MTELSETTSGRPLVEAHAQQDLLAALQSSVERARQQRRDSQSRDSQPTLAPASVVDPRTYTGGFPPAGPDAVDDLVSALAATARRNRAAVRVAACRLAERGDCGGDVHAVLADLGQRADAEQRTGVRQDLEAAYEALTDTLGSYGTTGPTAQAMRHPARAILAVED